MLGSPALDVKDFYKTYALFKKLPDLNQRLRELENKVSRAPGSFQQNTLSVDR